ncbi:MAG: hypothetical protein M3083_15785, partial [Actinomycetota bacterium]|nr:hypothetical protein [Actinomycetota bacterium]
MSVLGHLRASPNARGGCSCANVCMTVCDTLVAMAEAISVRLDDEAEQALRALEAKGLTRSEAIRSALVKAAQALRNRDELAAEVAELEADAV